MAPVSVSVSGSGFKIVVPKGVWDPAGRKGRVPEGRGTVAGVYGMHAVHTGRPVVCFYYPPNHPLSQVP